MKMDRMLSRKVAGQITFICMKWVFRLAAIVLAIHSILPLGLGFVLTKADSVPTRKMSSRELDRAKLATAFVEVEAKRLGRLPTHREWSVLAPPDLRADGQGFEYSSADERYAFSWWDGDFWVTWHSKGERGSVLMSPKDFFVFGSKRADLAAFFGTGAVMLIAAWGLIQLARKSGSHASRLAH